MTLASGIYVDLREKTVICNQTLCSDFNSEYDIDVW